MVEVGAFCGGDPVRKFIVLEHRRLILPNFALVVDVPEDLNACSFELKVVAPHLIIIDDHASGANLIVEGGEVDRIVSVLFDLTTPLLEVP